MFTLDHSVTCTIPTAWLRTMLYDLQRSPNAVATGPLGWNRTEAGHLELLVRAVHIVSEQESLQDGRTGEPRFELRLVPYSIRRPAAWESEGWALQFHESPPFSPTARIQLGSGDERGLLSGIYAAAHQIMPIRTLRAIGGGMAQFDAVDFVQPIPQLHQDETTRWSRVIGALNGPETWHRLTHLAIAIVGVGRTGSLVAASLARLGCRHMTLIDPDRLELHNVDAMDLVTPEDIGAFKVDVVARRMRDVHPQLEVCPLSTSVFSQEAQAELKAAQVIICTVDSPAARLLTGAIATMYLKPWLDLGTGVFRVRDGATPTARGPAVNRQIGADMRLILPGDGCLLCWGGVVGLSQALQDWARPRTPRDWQIERAGSLRSVNMLAVGTGLRWLEELVMGRLTASVWQRVEINEHGMAEWQTMGPRRDPACRLCAQTGLGDALTGMGHVP